MKARDITFDIDKNGCHVCTSHKTDKDGYVIVFRDGKARKLHRYLYQQVHNVVLSENEVIRHKCHNRRCINIAHLEHGTQYDNVQDTYKANRQAKGEKIQSHKLTENDIVYILSSKEKILTIKNKLNVSRVTISRIRNKRSWKHLIIDGDKHNQ